MPILSEIKQRSAELVRLIALAEKTFVAPKDKMICHEGFSYMLLPTLLFLREMKKDHQGYLVVDQKECDEMYGSFSECCSAIVELGEQYERKLEKKKPVAKAGSEELVASKAEVTDFLLAKTEIKRPKQLALSVYTALVALRVDILVLTETPHKKTPARLREHVEDLVSLAENLRAIERYFEQLSHYLDISQIKPNRELDAHIADFVAEDPSLFDSVDQAVNLIRSYAGSLQY